MRICKCGAVDHDPELRSGDPEPVGDFFMGAVIGLLISLAMWLGIILLVARCFP